MPPLRRATHAAGALLLACAAATTQPIVAAADVVPVLIYHEIVAGEVVPGETKISIERFDNQMRYLHDRGYRTLSIAELVDIMHEKRSMPERAVVLTFDDGWKNVLNAIPTLNRYGFKASFWIITGKGIGGEYLDWSDIVLLARNPHFEIGSHTVTHPWDRDNNLLTWTEGKVLGKGLSDAWEELVESKRTLQHELRRPTRFLAWPVGWYNSTLIQLAKDAGYEALLTTEDGGNRSGGDVYRIKRVFVDGRCDMSAFEHILADPRYRPCSTTTGP